MSVEELIARVREKERNRERAFGRLVFSIKRKFDHWAAHQILERHFTGLKPGHMPFLMHIGSEGTTTTQLARNLMVTKQAMSKTVSEIIALGLVEQNPNPTDARSSVLRLTKQGMEAVVTSRDCVEMYTGAISERMGKEKYEQLISLMVELDALMPDATHEIAGRHLE